MKETLIIRVICFSVVKQALNRNELEVKLPVGSTGSDLEKVIRKSANGKLDGIPMRIAVNQIFVSSELELKKGDEVVFIPPTQGG